MMSCGRLCDPETAAEKKACNTTGRKTFLILYEYMCRRSQRGVKRDEWVGGLDYHGYGTCASNSGIASILLPCVPPNSPLRRLRLILSLDQPNASPSFMDRRSGHAHRIPKALLEQISL